MMKLAQRQISHANGPQSGVRRIDVSEGLRLDPDAAKGLPVISLEAVASSTLTHARGVMPRAISLTFAKVGVIPNVRGDSDRIMAALLELLKNACASIDRYGSILVRLAYPDDGTETPAGGDHDHYVRLDVIDTGRGMPGGTCARVIETLKTGRRNSATGRGLPIVYAVLRRHGGDALVHCRERGTRVSLYFPIAS